MQTCRKGCAKKVPVTRAVSRGPHPPPQNVAAKHQALPFSLLRIYMALGDLFLHGLFWTAHFYHSLLGWARCLFGKFGGSLKQTVGGDLTVSLVPWYSPCLICTVHRGCLCIAYRISPRDCCFVTFCTIVLAGFVLHAVLKENFHTLLWLLFPYIYIFLLSLTKSRGLSSSPWWFIALGPWLSITALSDVPPTWHDMCRCAAALVNGHNKCHFTKKEQLWKSKILLGG